MTDLWKICWKISCKCKLHHKCIENINEANSGVMAGRSIFLKICVSVAYLSLTALSHYNVLVQRPNCVREKLFSEQNVGERFKKLGKSSHPLFRFRALSCTVLPFTASFCYRSCTAQSTFSLRLSQRYPAILPPPRRPSAARPLSMYSHIYINWSLSLE